MMIRHFIALALLLTGIAAAQPTVAPSNERVGSPRGENWTDYNITNSFETGYRWRTVDGNLGKYRSDVNFGNGIRLLGSSFTMNSRDGHGHYFDELIVNTLGLGNDPYQNANLRIQKNSLYRYDLQWRENDYYNPALTIANGQHFLNTSRKMQDQTFTLFPQGALRLYLGYGRNSQNGPALTTTQIFDSRGDEFPLFSNVRRLQDEYRLGGEIGVAGVRLSIVRGWEHFRDDTEENGTPLVAGNNPTDATTLTLFRRTQPYHGSTDSWRVNLLTDRSKLYSVNGRFTYAGGRRDFLFDENLAGTSRFGGTAARQILVAGNARRPSTTASLTASLFPTSRVTVVNHTAFTNTRMDGDGTYSELNNTTLQAELVHFQFLGIRTIANTTDATYRVTNWWTLHGGYQFSNRRIRSIEQVSFANTPDAVRGEQENTLHAGTFGMRLRPEKRLSILLDAEVGRSDRPFFPVSDKNYQLFSGRIQWKSKSLLLSAAARSNYNTNSSTLSAYSSRSRGYSADATWTPATWFSFDAGYNKMHLDTMSGIAYFSAGEFIDNDRSVYISNIHAANLGMRFGIGRRIDLYLGYSRVQDTGDGRSLGAALLVGAPNSVVSPFYFAQTFPLSFESPLARVSVRLSNKIRWNVGYQYYRYGEEFGDIQDYRAHTGFTSLTWAF